MIEDSSYDDDKNKLEVARLKRESEFEIEKMKNKLT